jgi:hypothetical protein
MDELDRIRTLVKNRDELGTIDASDLRPKAKFMAQMLWISRNFLRELPTEPGPLQNWSIHDIILATRDFMEHR